MMLSVCLSSLSTGGPGWCEQEVLIICERAERGWDVEDGGIVVGVLGGCGWWALGRGQ